MRELRLLSATFSFVLCWTFAVWAQSADDVVWVQIEAHPSLTTAESRAAQFDDRLENVNGFSLGGGWYGIVLGPYRRLDAEQVLRVYRSEGVIPRDSYIAYTDTLREQFYPEGADILDTGSLPAPADTAEQAEEDAQPDTEVAQAEPEVTETQTDTPAQQEVQAPAPEPEIVDETPAEARRSEQALDRDERRALQVALQWAGFYNSAIDGLFGRGTRNSMAAWQEANGFEATGILTTMQRAELFRQYNAVLEGLGLQTVRDARAGVQITMPTGVVAFDAHDYPFARYAPTGDIPAQVLLISQAGDQNTLYGLYDIMQTLEIVPLQGERQRNRSSFVLEGRNDRIVSYTEASLENGEIKGFTLVWPAGDEERRTRLLDEMRASFSRAAGVLDPSWTESTEQAIDLVAGLQIRKPKLNRSGFFVNSDGAVVTTLQAVQGCGRVTLDEEIDAQLIASDDRLGIAVLKPQTSLAPRAVAQFAPAPPRLKSEVAVSGFSYGGVLEVATLTFGELEDVRGLRGEEDISRLALETFDSDAGGPVFDETGSVMGMLLPRTDADRQLPDAVSFAADGAVLQSLLSGNGISSVTASATSVMAPEDITAQARKMTVLVSCWE